MIKKIKRNKLTILILAALIVFMCVVRFVNLKTTPAGFHIDEASLGYNAYSLLQTGKSDEGKFLPLYVDIFGDNRPSGYHFLAILPVALFGLTEVSTRLPGAIFGIATIVPFYFLCLYLSKSNKIALVSAFLLAIAPWHTVLSRASAETIVALFFILLGFYLFLKSIIEYRTKLLIFSLLVLSCSFFLYHTPRVFVPLIVIATSLLYYKNFLSKKKRNFKTVFVVGVFAMCLVSFALVFLVKGGSGRFTQVNVFSHPETRLVLEEHLREDGPVGVGPLEARIYHNKLNNFGFDFIANYLEYFDGDFLFISGGLPVWYDVDRMGLLHIFELPFLVIGFILLIKKKTRLSFIPIIWIGLAPLVAALTIDDIPNFQRAIVLFPMLEFVTAYGFISFIYFLGKKWMRIIFLMLTAGIVIYSEAYFMHMYFVHGSTHRTWYRNNGFAEMMGAVNENYDKYDKVVMTKTGGGYPLVLFYSRYNPQAYINEGSPKDADYKGFGKFVFVPNECPSVNESVVVEKGLRAIYVDRGTCPEPGKQVNYKNIYREDGSLGFRVVYR